MTSSLLIIFLFFFFKQKTAYELRISDWSSDVCSSDLLAIAILVAAGPGIVGIGFGLVGLVALAVAVSLYVLAYLRRSGRLLRQREESFRDITEMSDDWIWATEAENKLTFLYDCIETLTSWSKEAQLSKRNWELSRD